MRGKEVKTRRPFAASPRVFILGCTLVVLSVQFFLSRRAHSEQLRPASRAKPVTAVSRLGGTMLRPQFVLFGDSITQHGFSEGGWCARLANEYSRKADVVLRGYSGYNTAWALHLLARVFPEGMRPPALVTIFFGANDAVLKGRISEKQHVPLDQYLDNVRSIVQHVRRIGANATVIITPPPIYEPDRLIDRQRKHGVNDRTALPERTNEMTGQYAAACRKLGVQLGVPVLDLWTQLQTQPDWNAHLSDGLHLSAAGNEAVYLLLSQLIREQFPALRSDAMSWDFPMHNDIDERDPATAFTQHSATTSL